jgi:cytochrome P450
MKSPDEFVFTDPAVQANPQPYFAAMRSQGPVYREPMTGVYFITTSDEIRKAADQPEIFSNVIDPSQFRACSGGKMLEEKDPAAAAIFKEKGWLMPFTLLFNDPPLHGHYRKLAAEALTPKRVKEMEPFIQQQTDNLIARFSPDGNVEFVSEFATKLPVSAIAEFLGAPEEDWPKINYWSEQTFSTLFGQASEAEYRKTIDAILEMQHYVAGKIEEQKAHPKDNLLRSLMTAHEIVGGEPLKIEEILSIYHVLLVAGHDTTRQTLGNSLRVLAEFPDLARQLREDPRKINDFINEVLRLYHPAGIGARITRQEVTVCGVTIPEGSTVYFGYSSANHDENKFSCPAHFDMERDFRDSFSFGYGIHFCVGSRLAKTILTVAINTLLREFSEIKLNTEIDKLEYMPVILHSSLRALPLKFIRR